MNVDDITRHIEDQVAQARAHADRMKAWSTSLEQLSGEGTALRGAVKVTVNNAGVLTSLKLSDAALDAGAAGLSSAILAAIGAAKQAVADDVGRSAADQFGAEGEVTTLMVSDMARRMGVTADLNAPRMPRTSRPSGGVIG